MIPFETKAEVTICGFPFDCKIEGTIDHQKEERDTGIPEAFCFDEIQTVSVFDYANCEYIEVSEPLKGMIARQFEEENAAADCVSTEAPR